jgi:hypothetical protein
MKSYKKFFLYTLLIGSCILTNAKAQSLLPSVISSDGGYYNAGGNSLSWTLGETFNTTLINGNVMLTQGEQQPYIHLRLLNLKAFIEGFYLGGGQMSAVLYNNDPMSYPTNYCDSIKVELHHATLPFSLVTSKEVILLTNGNALVQFPEQLDLGSYYVVVKHRNSIETWSKAPLLFNGSPVSLDFTTP